MNTPMTSLTERRAKSTDAFLWIALMSTTLSYGAQGWQRMPDLPEPNGGMIGYAVGEDIVIAGGVNWEHDTKHWLAKRWRFNAAANDWKPVPPLPAPLAYAAGNANADANVFLAAGGSDGQKSCDAILEWQADLPPRKLAKLSQPVTLAGAAFANDQLLVIGGVADIADFSTVTAQCFAWRAGSKEVQRVPDYPAGPTAMVAAAAVKGRIFAFTGATWDAATKQVVNRNSAFAFDLASRAWKSVRPYPLAARGVTAMSLSGNRILLAGGFSDSEEGFTDKSFIYDTAADRYEPCVRLPIRAFAHLVKTREWLWLLGGEDRQKHRSAACWRIRTVELSPDK